jgi:3-oxoacyl-(acyl-carrier-protein) synthase
MTGHLLGGAGGLESVRTLYSVKAVAARMEEALQHATARKVAA